jgi:transposase-like protein
MNPPPATNPYKRHRFPAEIISHSVWLYYRFSLSYRDVEELMAERGVPCRTKPCGTGVESLARPMQMRYVADVPDLGTNGMLMKSS